MYAYSVVKMRIPHRHQDVGTRASSVVKRHVWLVERTGPSKFQDPDQVVAGAKEPKLEECFSSVFNETGRMFFFCF